MAGLIAEGGTMPVWGLDEMGMLPEFGVLGGKDNGMGAILSSVFDGAIICGDICDGGDVNREAGTDGVDGVPPCLRPLTALKARCIEESSLEVEVFAVVAFSEFSTSDDGGAFTGGCCIII